MYWNTLARICVGLFEKRVALVKILMGLCVRVQQWKLQTALCTWELDHVLISHPDLIDGDLCCQRQQEKNPEELTGLTKCYIFFGEQSFLKVNWKIRPLPLYSSLFFSHFYGGKKIEDFCGRDEAKKRLLWKTQVTVKSFKAWEKKVSQVFQTLTQYRLNPNYKICQIHNFHVENLSPPMMNSNWEYPCANLCKLEPKSSQETNLWELYLDSVTQKTK